MNAEVRTRWLEALRSGKYKQEHNRLRSVGGHYCCLGVLCDVLDSSSWRKIDGCPWFYEGSWSGLSSKVQEKVGLDNERVNELIRLNDSKGLKFPQIADWIEANVPADPGGTP